MLGGARIDGDDAVARGLVHRVKLHGRWLYLDPTAALDAALSDAAHAVDACLRDWLIGHNPYLVGAAAKRTTALQIGRIGLDLLLRELARMQRIGTLPVLNASYQPYLAYFRLADIVEV